ncbi:MAG: glutathione S-transferase family protein [Rhodospirillales bacterium]|jgi:GST-like protein|nr:glutathione S-transferase family protein [Rhodospirillales bacterium]MBT5076484.1 glutathione S-transferase family protein [Rhodospirillales bacterium]MBT5112622.1 glutathione S-transferase family protein [Rhodospirillales bacterium]MBT5673391.1 glutathione S-transferase family protein [Rhodospirillales bacterium]MBT6186050.1 glutathione S-transferase family protein [Rhodospirillales bacterium]
MPKKIDAYLWTTGNARKIFVMFEETGLEYNTLIVNIRKGEQFAPDFLKISPNNKIPVIVDPDGPDGETLSIFESGAILEYLGDKSGQLLPKSGVARYKVIEWLHLVAANLGPALGQAHYFVHEFPEGNEHAATRFRNETARLFKVLDEQLIDKDWIATDAYTIADISAYGRVRGWKNAGIQIDDTPRLKDWLARIEARPAVQRADKIIQDLNTKLRGDVAVDQHSILYGDRQMARK